ncbi:MAG: DUF4367 domain-containing protein [Clostridia bacterium]|nr:DUF4367 domain-containing protein [Clostridia bacterium]
MKFDDKQLAQAAKELSHAMGTSLSKPEEQVFSPAFEEKMEQLLKKQRRQKYLKRIACSAASILALLITVGCLFLALNTEARAYLQTWYRSVSIGRYTYRFNEDRRGQPLPDYEVTWLPEGYRYNRTRRFENTTLVSYRKESPTERYITPLGLEYFWISDQMALTVGAYGNHTVTQQQVTVNGKPAHLYENINSSNGQRDYILVWIDQEAGLVFRLGTSLSIEETIAVAENIRPVK